MSTAKKPPSELRPPRAASEMYQPHYTVLEVNVKMIEHPDISAIERTGYPPYIRDNQDTESDSKEKQSTETITQKAGCCQ